MKAATKRMQLWREKNRERQRENDRRFREKNKDKINARQREKYLENRESELARNKDYYAVYYPENRERIKAQRRNGRHKITPDWFENKIKEQDNRCALCHEVFVKTPHIDHDHSCCAPLKSCDKCRRDLLCEDCNLGLGRFKDNSEVLLRAVAYIKRHKERNESPASN